MQGLHPAGPRGCTGKDTPDGKKNPHDIMLVAKDGSATVYPKYEGNKL